VWDVELVVDDDVEELLCLVVEVVGVVEVVECELLELEVVGVVEVEVPLPGAVTR
jgi:hypothetical protein